MKISNIVINYNNKTEDIYRRHRYHNRIKSNEYNMSIKTAQKITLNKDDIDDKVYYEKIMNNVSKQIHVIPFKYLLKLKQTSLTFSSTYRMEIITETYLTIVTGDNVEIYHVEIHNTFGIHTFELDEYYRQTMYLLARSLLENAFVVDYAKKFPGKNLETGITKWIEQVSEDFDTWVPYSINCIDNYTCDKKFL